MTDYLALLTRPDVQQFIAGQERADVQELILRHKEILGVPSLWIATQIIGRRKAKEKLPLWYNLPGIVYPPSLNLEQCSSEATARYKQNLLKGHHSADLTGGFGVDTFFFSRVFDLHDYVEPDESLLTLAQHNHFLLGAGNIRYHKETAEQFIRSTDQAFDLIYVDPSRRADDRKVIRLADAIPNVVAMQEALLQRSRQLLIKASPLLDLKQVSRELPFIDQFIVLAHENECKELLIMLRRGNEPSEPTIHAVNLERDGEPTPFAFTWTQEKAAHVEYGNPRGYLYEPNSAIMKAGAFKLIGQQYGLTKLAAGSHLYTADEKYDEFPGRLFKNIEQVVLNKSLCAHFDGGQANILVRNFPQTVEEVKKQTGLTEGGTDYLICTRTDKPIVLIARRLR